MTALIPTDAVIAARKGWRWTGDTRPEFAEPTAEGHESVWDYPRPPRIERTPALLRVVGPDGVIAETNNGARVLETSHPPTFYFPPGAVARDQIRISSQQTHCEWKGLSNAVVYAATGARLGWTLTSAYPEFATLETWFAFYPDSAECSVDGHVVVPQAGSYYGGWVVPGIKGPFKGGAGSQGW